MASRSSAARELASKPSVTVKRRLNASPQQVYAAWTDPEKLAAWFGPSKVKEGSLQAETDLRVGGAYRISFSATDGEYFQVSGVYREIEPHKRLVFTFAWDNDGPSAGVETLVTILFEARGGKTVQTFHQRPFRNIERRDSHVGGWNGAFDRLATYAAKVANVT